MWKKGISEPGLGERGEKRVAGRTSIPIVFLLIGFQVDGIFLNISILARGIIHRGGLSVACRRMGLIYGTFCGNY